MIIEVSLSEYLKWFYEQLEDVEILSDLKGLSNSLPEHVVKKGFKDAQEFLMEMNKDNPVFFTFFVYEIIDISAYGADQIVIKWID